MPALRKTPVPATLILFAIAALQPSNEALAQGQKIGYVDVKAVASRSTSIQNNVREVEGKLRVKQEAMESQLREFRAAKKDFDSQRSVLAEPEARKQDRKLADMRDQLDAMQLEIDRELRRTESEVMGPAVDRIIESVRRIGKARGFDLILTNDVVIYGAESIDLTPLVIQDLDQEAAGSSGAADPPPPAKPAETGTSPKSDPKPAAPKNRAK